MPRVFFYILIIYLSLLQKNLLLGRFLLSRWTDRLGCLLASRVENHHGHSHGPKLFLGSKRADQKKVTSMARNLINAWNQKYAGTKNVSYKWIFSLFFLLLILFNIFLQQILLTTHFFCFRLLIRAQDFQTTRSSRQWFGMTKME